jgi:hypothetical protein
MRGNLHGNHIHRRMRCAPRILSWPQTHRERARQAANMSADDASGPVKAAHKAAIEEVARRNEAAHKRAKEKRKTADRKAELYRRAERDK